ncbi:MAG: hypothetical protein HY615_14805, partial [Candidatus Rokubacteria bacterium]|nr:hypothetical protein [Candidatus Rokubacteria bacterium]
VSIYAAHMGNVAASLDLLTAVASNAQGQTAGPFMASIPATPAGWSTPYSYAPNTSAGTFVISATGDGATASAP